LRPSFDTRGPFALVPNSGSDTITFLDLASGMALGSAPSGRNPFVLDSPHDIATDHGRGVGYVALAYPPSSDTGQHAHGTSGHPGWVQKIALSDLHPIGEVSVDANPGELALSDDGTRLVVSHFDLKTATAPGLPVEKRRATLALIDPSQVLAEGSPDPDRLLVCVAPHGIALSRPDGKRAYVSCYGEDVVAIVNLEDTHAPVVRVPVGASPTTTETPTYGPYTAVLSPSGKRLAIGSTASKDVRFFDVESGAMESLVIPTLGAAFVVGWSDDGSRVYVPTQATDALQVFDAATGAQVAARPLAASACVRPHQAQIAGGTLYVVCEGDGASPGVVLGLDPVSLETTRTFAVGLAPGRAAFVTP
jgi:DNA-binding beta-propeller fold protein YncE